MTEVSWSPISLINYLFRNLNILIIQPIHSQFHAFHKKFHRTSTRSLPQLEKPLMIKLTLTCSISNRTSPNILNVNFFNSFVENYPSTEWNTRSNAEDLKPRYGLRGRSKVSIEISNIKNLRPKQIYYGLWPRCYIKIRRKRRSRRCQDRRKGREESEL